MATETKGWFKSNATSIVAIAALITPMYFMVGNVNDQIAANRAENAELRKEARQNEIARREADAEILRLLVGLTVFVKGQHPELPDRLLAKMMERDAPESAPTETKTPPLELETPPPLHIAARENDTAKAQRLLGGGADVNAKYNGGETPLHAAAGEGAADVAALLLKHGADISAKDSGGETPLHIAEHKGHTNVAQLIRNHRATG